MDSFIRSKHHVVHGRLFGISGLSALVPNHNFHAAQSRIHRRNFYAHALGTFGIDVYNIIASTLFVGVNKPYGD